MPYFALSPITWSLLLGLLLLLSWTRLSRPWRALGVGLWVVLLLLCAPLALHAQQQTVFYKCTDAKGNVSMQNGVPCGPGMKQEVKRIGEVKTVPVPVKKPIWGALPTGLHPGVPGQ